VVFDTKVVYREDKFDVQSVMDEEAWCVVGLVVSVDALVNFVEKFAVFNQIMQFVFVARGHREVLHRDPHVLVAVQRRAQVEIADVYCHKFGTL
jgi:hypothetical protein